jgi:hypothetical protein
MACPIPQEERRRQAPTTGTHRPWQLQARSLYQLPRPKSNAMKGEDTPRVAVAATIAKEDESSARSLDQHAGIALRRD